MAAFDIGSGSTKVVVAESLDCGTRIGKVLMSQSTPVAYRDDLAAQERTAKKGPIPFSTAIQDQGFAVLKTMSENASAFSPVERVGVATEAFRRASNGAEIAKDWSAKLGIKIKVIPQEEEARLGYFAALSTLSTKPDFLIVWDVGGGSQEMTWETPSGLYVSVLSDLAAVTFKNLVLQKIKKRPPTVSPNPLSEKEIERAVKLCKDDIKDALQDSPMIRELKKRLADKASTIVGIGGVFGSSVSKQLGLKPGERITAQALRDKLKEKAGQDDAALGGGKPSPYVATDVTNLILVLAMMEALRVDSVLPTHANLADALILKTGS